MWDANNNVWIEGEMAARIVLYKDGRFVNHDVTVNDFNDTSLPKPPKEWIE
jgi:hypothetical protein